MRLDQEDTGRQSDKALSNWTRAMYNFHEDLKSLASQFKANEQPATDQDFEAFVEEIKQYGVSNPAIPDQLEALWKIASEWHLIDDNYDVFGFNIYGPKKIVQTTKNVFGDGTLEKNGYLTMAMTPAVVQTGYTEYDYIFMNFNKQSDLFAATRHMVNNCNEDEELTKPPFANFVGYIKTYIENFKEEEVEGEEEI
ncbi:unnamed protein product [Umbelopsis vinacea]